MDSFSDKLPAQYHYYNRRLQDSGQGRDDSAEEIGDRCRKLCQHTIRTVQDEVRGILTRRQSIDS